MNLNKCKLNGMDFWYRRGDAYVGERVAEGKYEEYETKLILRQVNKDSVVVDVGANIGYYTIQLAQKCKKVYAFEPDKDNFEILKKNVDDNKLVNVVLINAAVGDTKENVKLYKSAVNDGDHRLYDPGNRTNVSNIFCVRLDDILINEQIIDLIKIDTQGWEPAVIGGAVKIIKRDSPVLFLEYWPKAYDDAKQDSKIMIKFLKSIYKNIWQIDSYLNTYKKEIKVDNETGYADLWMSRNETNIWQQYRDLKIKKLIKMFIR